MTLLALRHQRVTRQRVGIFAADQRPQSADSGIAHLEPCAIAVGPDELLVERRHELAMVVQYRAVIADQQVGVPETADAGIASFVDADRNKNFPVLRFLA